jgi:hypothetical protein
LHGTENFVSHWLVVLENGCLPEVLLAALLTHGVNRGKESVFGVKNLVKRR